MSDFIKSVPNPTSTLQTCSIATFISTFGHENQLKRCQPNKEKLLMQSCYRIDWPVVSYLSGKSLFCD